MHHHSHARRPFYEDRGTLGLFTLVAGVTLGFTVAKLTTSKPLLRPNDAPRKASRRGSSRGFREDTVVGRTVTINRPRQEVYQAWRDVRRFPDFMDNVIQVTPLDERRAHWRVKGPGETEVEFDTEITEDRPGEVIAWKSAEGADVSNSGRVTFRDAPGNRGTQVDATIAYDPPAGTVGRLTAKLFQREPQIQARRELKRFKQLMETGEIAVAEPGPAAPRGQEE
jgi:uncharacterized membrane protein